MESHPHQRTASVTASHPISPASFISPASPLQHSATHIGYAACPSLTGELLRQSLSEFLRTQILYVTQVIVLAGFNQHQLTHDDDIPITDGKLCYAALTQCELILIDRASIGQLSLSPIATSFEEILKNSAAGKQQTLFCVHRKAICEQLTALYNTHFELAAMMPEPAAAIAASAQAALMAHAQVAASHIYTTQGVGSDLASSGMDPLLLHAGGALTLNRLIPNNRFSVITTSSNHSSTLGRVRRLEWTFQNTSHIFKHPAEQFFQSMPSKYRGHIFHRCGYMFATRRPIKAGMGLSGGGVPDPDVGHWMDSASLFLNRPTATYRFVSPADQESNLTQHQRKFLQLHICPEKPISPFSNIVKSRDLRGSSSGRALGKATLKELLKGRDDCDDDDFFMWSESIARAIAMNECRLTQCHDYFVPQSLVHTKKINPVGDKSSWSCFKIHIYTPLREIGIITCRRKCLPPYFDTFQDFVFVLYGRCALSPAAFKPQDGSTFLQEIEMIVDSLSPTTVPLPYHYVKGLSLAIVHPTYADLLVSQGRVNSLLNNSMAYHWLGTRPWISSFRGEMGIFPTTEFLGSACFRLAKSFANSILVRVTHRRERVAWAEYLPVAIEGIGSESVEDESTANVVAQQEEKDGSTKPTASAGADTKETDSASSLEGGGDGATAGPAKQGIALVADPMIIVSRMLTEFAAAEAATRRKQGPQRTTYSAEEEWRCRVSQYLAYCVDDGIFPGALNIKRLLSVLTRAFLDAPILSLDTSMKLDRVVDFLLYLKPRCGTPITLPSWQQAAQIITATTKAKRQGQRDRHQHQRAHPPHTTAHSPKQATAAVTNSASPFACLTAQSPAALFTEAPTDDAGTYDYDESSTLLQKLRDKSLIVNFTCNEHIMIPLLDTSYIESLEKATIGTAMHQEGSVIPELLCNLLNKDYNVDLIRAVRDKIISYEIHDLMLIPPLIALMKDGTQQTSQYALHALTMIAKYHPDEVIAAGGASVPMWFVFMSKNELLLSASIDLILALFTDATRSIFAQSAFASKLVDLLRPRVGGARYQNVVLQKTALLMYKLALIPELLQIFLAQYAHRELIEIIGEYDNKRPILLEISACLAQLFVCAKNKMLTTPSEHAKESASTIAQTMAKCTTKAQLRICLHLLLALQILIRLPHAFYARLSNTMTNALGKKQFTAPDKAFTTRVHVLQHLYTVEGLENVLERATASSDSELLRCERLLRSMNALEEVPNPAGGKPRIRLLAPEGDTSDPLSTAAKIVETIQAHTLAKNVLKIAAWFTLRMKIAVDTKWDVNMIWQTDTKKFLAVPNTNTK